MKRSPLRRKKGLKKSSGLKTRKPLKSGASLASGSSTLRRKKLRQVSKRKARERSAEERFRAAVLERAHESCERCTSEYQVEAHHVVPRGRARRHPLLHDDRNGAALCAKCHQAVHGAGDLEDREKWLKPARFLDDMKPYRRLAEVDPSVAFAIRERAESRAATHNHEEPMQYTRPKLTAAPRVARALIRAARSEGPNTLHLLHRGVRYQASLRVRGSHEGQILLNETAGAWTVAAIINADTDAEIEWRPAHLLDPDGAVEALLHAESDLEAVLVDFHADTGRCALCNVPPRKGFAHAECLTRFGVKVGGAK